LRWTFAEFSGVASPNANSPFNEPDAAQRGGFSPYRTCAILCTTAESHAKAPNQSSAPQTVKSPMDRLDRDDTIRFEEEK
jgi:hypothetical protein